MRVGRVAVAGRVHDEDDRVAGEKGSLGPGDSFPLGRALRVVAQPRGVHKRGVQALQHGRFLDGVARRPGRGCDDGAVSAEEGVEQAGLAGVGAADQADAQALALGAAAVVGGQHSLERRAQRAQRGVGLFVGERRDVLVRMVEACLEEGQDLQDRGPGVAHDARDSSLESVQRGCAGPLAAGADQGANGLRLGEVELPVGEGAARELAGRGGARSRLHGGRHQLAHDFGGDVGRELQEVLSGGRVPSLPEDRHDPVHGPASVPRQARRRAPRLQLLGPQKLAGDAAGPGPADADDRESGPPDGGGRGDDGVAHTFLGRMTSLRQGPSPSDAVVMSGFAA